jgi:hypothetical protein
MFRAVWKTFNTKFKHILEDIGRHDRLIQQVAHILHFEEFQRHSQSFQDHIKQYNIDTTEIFRYIETYRINHDRIFAEFERIQNSETQRKCREVIAWFGASMSTTLDHERFRSTRNVVPSSGHWLLGHEKVENWINPDIIPTSSILWISGTMGIGMFAPVTLLITADFK